MEADSGGARYLTLGGLASLFWALVMVIWLRLRSKHVHHGKVTSSSAVKFPQPLQSKAVHSHFQSHKYGNRKVRNQRPPQPNRNFHSPSPAKKPSHPADDESLDMRSSINLRNNSSSNSSPVHSPYVPQPKTQPRNGAITVKGIKHNHMGPTSSDSAPEDDDQGWFSVTQIRSIMNGIKSKAFRSSSNIDASSAGQDSESSLPEAGRKEPKPYFTSPAKRPTIMPSSLIDEFAQLALENTDADIETLGLLGGSETFDGKIVVSHLILPPQHGASDSCEVDDYADVFNIFMERNLLQVGWIHTHPSYAAFMSSVDLHNHVASQKDLAEYFAIVLAPKEDPDYGIFTLTDAGLNELSNCSGGLKFHKHHSEEILYESATHVKIDENEETQIIVIDRRREGSNDHSHSF